MIHNLRLYCVCDGHGLNGHLVSAFIKANLISKHLTIKRKPKLIFKEVSQSTIKRTNG